MGKHAQRMATLASMIVQMEALVDVQVVSDVMTCLRYGIRIMDTKRMLQ